MGRFTEGELDPGSPRPPGDFDLVLGREEVKLLLIPFNSVKNIRVIVYRREHCCILLQGGSLTEGTTSIKDDVASYGLT